MIIKDPRYIRQDPCIRTGTSLFAGSLVLYGLPDFFICQFVIFNKWSHKGIEIGESLGTGSFSLQGEEEVNDLAESTAQVSGRTAFDFAGYTREPSHNQVFKVPTAAVWPEYT